jgi:hypothetical protein
MPQGVVSFSSMPLTKGGRELFNKMRFLPKLEAESCGSRHSRLRLRGGRLRRESRNAPKDWIPAFAGMTQKKARGLWEPLGDEDLK